MLASLLFVGMLTCVPVEVSAPQGDPDRTPGFALPEPPWAMAVTPYRDAQGQPLRCGTRATGAADFDGNGVQDLWFVAGAGPQEGAIAVKMARTATVGRYRDWHVEPATPNPLLDGATLRSAMTEQDLALFVAPGLPGLRRLQFTRSTTGDPRIGPTALWSMGPFLPFTIPDLGIYEIESRNDSGDSCDDLVLLIESGGGAATEVRKLRLVTGAGGYTVAATVRVVAPVHLQRLRLLDVDGDGETDFLAEAPGLGVVVGRDAGNGAFSLQLFVPTSQVQVVDLFTGALVAALDAKTGDAFGICLPDAVLLGWWTVGGLQIRLLPAPAGATPLATAAIANGSVDHAELVGVPRSGQSLWLQRYDRSPGTFGVPELLLPEDPVAYQGPGTLELAALCVDVDGDCDDDLMLQHADGTSFHLARNAGMTLAPIGVQVQHLGPLGAESGFFWERITAPLPDDWYSPLYDEVEVAVFLEHPATGEQVFWDRQILPVDIYNRRVQFDVFMQVIDTRVIDMHNNPAYWRPLFYPLGMTAGGFTQISIHGKAASSAYYVEKPRRFESLLVIHDPGGHGNKSAQGVEFEAAQEPPLPRADDDILPWN